MVYTAPTYEDLQERYPAFASTAQATIELWLDEAAIECAGWPDDDRARAEMAYAAHMMVETGALPSAVPGGLVSFKSGDFSATVDSAVAGRTGFDATAYGREFKRLMRRNFAGGIPAWTPPDAG